MQPVDDPKVYDFIGLGFGPSNLSLAIAAEEKAEKTGQPINDLYFDAQEEFNWHEGMLFDTSRMQVVFLKDLITMQNPRSKFTFINYLFEHNRLHEFINLRTFYPTRLEFNDYYRWVASHFQKKVNYGWEITSIEPVSTSDDIRIL